jgi:uncharacterized protein (DUF2126 family)
LAIYWRSDGARLWGDESLLADTRRPGRAELSVARDFTGAIAVALGLPPEMVLTAYEDVSRLLGEEAALPINADPLQSDLSDPTERSRLARLLLSGLDRPAGFVLPLKAAAGQGPRRAPVGRRARGRCVANGCAVAGDSPLGRGCRCRRCRSCCPRKRKPSTRSTRSRPVPHCRRDPRVGSAGDEHAAPRRAWSRPR